MDKKSSLLKSAKYIILIVFLVLSVISVLLTGTVKINYNISDYLDDSTETKISLGIMEEEFGLISNIQVMVNDVTPDEAEVIKDRIKSIENVIFVNFNSQNPDYYKDNTALFVVLVNGNEYSKTAKAALADIQKTFSDSYGDRLELGGTVMEKKLLREAIQGEIILILGISVCLVALLMLITASSWIEPLVLLAASGIAVLLNMGTNAVFGEISYITNAIAAILQLALSIDYSIVLLHSYRAIKNEETDNDRAMLRAIKEVVKPVSASALTTMAGLLALLFMSFTIGFDIGSVLMKSIIISAITSLTLLPALLLIFDGLMQKTAKKSLVLKGNKFCDASFKAGKLIVPIACVIIAICCVLSLNNTYNFVDSCNKNQAITDKFGESGTLIVLYENADDTEEKEKILAELLASYKKEDGTPVLKSHVSYSSTVGQIFDVDKAAKDLGISKSDAELLFTIYRFTEDESAIKMDTRTFAEVAIALIETDSDAQGFVNEKTAQMLDLLLTLDVLMRDEYTADEFYNAVLSLEIMKDKELSKFAIDQMYGLYFFDSVENKDVAFKTMLDFVIGSEMLDSDICTQLQTLLDGVSDLTAPDAPVTSAEFNDLMKEMGVEFDSSLGNYPVFTIWNQLGYRLNQPIPDLELMSHLADSGYVTDQQLVRILENYRSIYKAVNEEYSYSEFIPALLGVTEMITGNTPDVSVPDTAMQQLYIMYFYDSDQLIPDRIQGRKFVEFILATAETNETVKAQFPDGISEMLIDVLALDDFLDDPSFYDYKGMTERITSFASTIKSMEVSISLSDAAMMGLYVKYAVQNQLLETGTISATELLDFVLDASVNNQLLAGRIDEEMRETITESQENIISAEKLLVAKNYSRMLLTVNLPPESAESSRFVEYLIKSVKDTFGESAYVAGEIATTNDLIKAFDDDNRLISIFTVVSIFVIIMLVFKSLSLPIILVAIIQGAIWIAMSMSLVGGGSMFFMSYIMSMCILMGATIDYGILLSTNYVRERQQLDKKEALYKAVDATLPTVFTSGLILMICGLVVGLIASQTSISSVGFLLFRGTLVSTVMIILVLPSILYLLDKFVIKLTLKEKTK